MLERSDEIFKTLIAIYMDGSVTYRRYSVGLPLVMSGQRDG